MPTAPRNLWPSTRRGRVLLCATLLIGILCGTIREVRLHNSPAGFSIRTAGGLTTFARWDLKTVAFICGAQLRRSDGKDRGVAIRVRRYSYDILFQ
jgi:hypothetical protein